MIISKEVELNKGMDRKCKFLEDFPHYLVNFSIFIWFFSFQTDHDPRNPAYIATQGPLPHTVADFWQVNKTLSKYKLSYL